MLQKFGVGVDIVKVERFQDKPYSKHKNFYKKIFLDSEIKYCLKHKNSAVHFSGKFAIKESVKKSICQKINFLNIFLNLTYFHNSHIILMIPMFYLLVVEHAQNASIIKVFSI